MNKKTLLVTLLTTTLGITGCSTINPYTGEEQTSSAVKGGALGAATGALVGVLASSKHDRARAH